MTPAQVTPTQADRDAAADWFVEHAGPTLEAECMREAKADHWPLVQAFARHRLSHSAAAHGEREAGSVGEAIRQGLCDWRETFKGGVITHQMEGEMVLCIGNAILTLAPPAKADADMAVVPKGIGDFEWQDMGSVPKDGRLFLVRFRANNVNTNPPQIQLAQWIDVYGNGGKLSGPLDYDSTPYADAWAPLTAPKALPTPARLFGAGEDAPTGSGEVASGLREAAEIARKDEVDE